ncbi:MAG: CoA transferase [Ramlibacter sp.]|nr:CoA transferase [Ramlibacter sp.]
MVEWLAGEGMAEDLTDPKWRDAALRAREVAHIRAVLGRWSLTHDADELYQTAQALRMPWAPVHTLRQVLDCPQLRARGFFGNGADASSASFPGLPFRLAGSRPPVRQVPRIGQHNDRLGSAHPARDAARARYALPATTARTQPLAGLRVLDFSWVLAGPYATRILADFGADVIKVQSLRSARDLDANHAAYFDMWNRNKRSLALDMSQPQARGVALDLVRACDVVVQNFSPRVMENWGLSYPALKALNPDLILLSLSAMGQTGPWRDHVAFGPALQALAGITQQTGGPQQPAVGLGTAHADHLMGLYGVLALLAALEDRAAGGAGQHLDVSGYEAARGLVGAELLQAASPIPPESLAPGAAPEGCYPCRGDDRWCALSVVDEAQWRALCEVAGQPQWLDNPAWRDAAGRAADALALDAAIAGWTARHDANELARRLQAAGVAATAVLDARGLLDDPQLRARGFFMPVIHPRRGPLLTDRSPIRFADEPSGCWRAAPGLGADSREVLREVLGYSDARIERLSRDGVLR